jgi:phosphoglycerate dehydrogenase-like enzyme
VQFNESESEWTVDELAARVSEAEVLITGWGSARLTESVLARASHLKLVSHSAGSVKFLLDEKLFARGIRVTTAGAAMITPVSEMTAMMCLLMLRPVHKLDAAMRAGQSWAELKVVGVGDELSSQTVGIVGAGQIGKRVIQLLRAWDINVSVYDPYYTQEQAAAACVRRCESLDDLLSSCRIITLHAPILPETKHMIGAAQLAKMRDGAILINTARAWLVDMDVLATELKQGRISVATDVFDEEPLTPANPWRNMPNTFITPHIASYTHQAFRRQGRYAVEETQRFLRGDAMKWEVTASMLKTMA